MADLWEAASFCLHRGTAVIASGGKAGRLAGMMMGLLLAAACGGCSALGIHPWAAAQGQPVKVEALGFAVLRSGSDLQTAHREALSDARANAVAQAHVFVESEVRLENMRLKGSTSRSHSRGYVQQMRVLESGIVPGTDPPLYRVRVEATVLPLEGADEPRTAADSSQQPSSAP
jgi:hypothetical protein